MNKKLIAAIGLIAVVGAGSVISSERAQAAPELRQTPYVNTEIFKTRNLDACQLKQFGQCMQKFGDYQMCYEQAQSYECPPE